MKASIIVDHVFDPAGHGFIARALVKLSAQLAPTPNYIPMNIALVLDHSGSMSGDKLIRAKEAAAMCVRRLRPDDVVSVVIFDDAVTTVAGPARGDAQADLPRAIEAITAGGSTNLSGGWLRGRQLLARGAKLVPAGAVNRLIVLTDGQANVGIKDPDQLMGLCRDAAIKKISTSTIGFGEDFDERLLASMADAGGGNTYYIETPEQAPSVFEEEIEGLLTLVAQNLQLHIQPQSATDLVRVRNVYPSRAVENGVIVDVGDLYAREPKSVLMEFVLPATPGPEPVQVASVVISADVITEGGGVEHQRITLSVSGPFSGEPHAEPEIERETLLLDAAEAQERAREMADDGDFESASTIIRESVACLRESGDASLATQAGDMEQLVARMSSDLFDRADAKYMRQQSYNIRRQKGMLAEKIRRAPNKKS